MKTPDSLFTVLGSIVLLAIVTTLVLPKRGTASDISAFGGAFAGSIKAALGN